MRISDWSSDVCSSDLLRLPDLARGGPRKIPREDHALRRLLPRRTKSLEGCIDGRPIERKAVTDNQISANAFAKAVIGITDGASPTNDGKPAQPTPHLATRNLSSRAKGSTLFSNRK